MGWYALALHEPNFGSLTFSWAAWCHKSVRKDFHLSLQNQYPLHHHSRSQTRGRSKTASSLATLFRFFFFSSSFFSSWSTRSQGTYVIWVLFILEGHEFADYMEGNKLDARTLSFCTDFIFTCLVEGGLVTRNYTRGACQSLEVYRLSPASSRVMRLNFFYRSNQSSTSSRSFNPGLSYDQLSPAQNAFIGCSIESMRYRSAIT